MKSEYVNPIGQRVVDVEFGYKIYDSEDKDFVVNIVGDNTKDGQYIYLDRDAFDNKSDEICFLSQPDLMFYEKEHKNICYESRSWEETKERITGILNTKAFRNFSGKSLNEKYSGSWDNFLNRIRIVYGLKL